MFLSFQMAPGTNFLAVFVQTKILKITKNISHTMKMYQGGGHLLEMYQKICVHYVAPPPHRKIIEKGVMP